MLVNFLFVVASLLGCGLLVDGRIILQVKTSPKPASTTSKALKLGNLVTVKPSPSDNHTAVNTTLKTFTTPLKHINLEIVTTSKTQNSTVDNSTELKIIIRTEKLNNTALKPGATNVREITTAENKTSFRPLTVFVTTENTTDSKPLMADNSTLKIIMTTEKLNVTNLKETLTTAKNKTELGPRTVKTTEVEIPKNSKPLKAVFYTISNQTIWQALNMEPEEMQNPTDLIESELDITPDYPHSLEYLEEKGLQAYLEAYFAMKISKRPPRSNVTDDGAGSIAQQTELFQGMSAFVPSKWIKETESESFNAKVQRMSNIQYLIRDHNPTLRVWHQINRNLSNVFPIWRSDTETKIIVHGLTPIDDHWTPAQRLKRMGLFQLGDEYAYRNNSINTILMNWTALSTYPHLYYPKAVDSVYFAGKDLANFILRLRYNGLELDRLHIIGHSLGAHVAAVAANWINLVLDEKVGRITGLDPAGPLYVDRDHLPWDTSKVLDANDAKFVDIIHTNMGDLFPFREGRLGKYGSKVQAGHVDFYPDGGELQNNCVGPAIPPNACSHRKSINYFRRSIFEDLLACPCESWELFQQGRCSCYNLGVLMGERVDRSARGRYYLTTAAKTIYMI